MKYAFIQAHAQGHRLTCLCAALGVSRSGYYAWRQRPPSARTQEDQRLLVTVRRLHEKTREQYGALKLWYALQRAGIPCGRHRVARLRRQHGLEAQRVRRFRVSVEHHQLPPPAPNRLQQHFVTTDLNRVWVGDLTMIPTRAGWLYLAVLLDLYSRRVVGWALRPTPEKQVAMAALQMALTSCRPRPGLIHHSDQGAQYASGAYRQLLQTHGLVASMSRKGHCYDNAVAESFFSTLKNELVHHRAYRTREEAGRDIFLFIEGFYNRQRLHQSLGYRSPLAFEQGGSDP